MNIFTLHVLNYFSYWFVIGDCFYCFLFMFPVLFSLDKALGWISPRKKVGLGLEHELGNAMLSSHIITP